MAPSQPAQIPGIDIACIACARRRTRSARLAGARLAFGAFLVVSIVAATAASWCLKPHFMICTPAPRHALEAVELLLALAPWGGAAVAAALGALCGGGQGGARRTWVSWAVAAGGVGLAAPATLQFFHTWPLLHPYLRCDAAFFTWLNVEPLFLGPTWGVFAVLCAARAGTLAATGTARPRLRWIVAATAAVSVVWVAVIAFVFDPLAAVGLVPLSLVVAVDVAIIAAIVVAALSWAQRRSAVSARD